MYLREQKKALSLFKTEGDVSVSVFVGLSLKENIEARSFVCKTHHKQPVNVVAYLRFPERSRRKVL